MVTVLIPEVCLTAIAPAAFSFRRLTQGHQPECTEDPQVTQGEGKALKERDGDLLPLSVLRLPVLLLVHLCVSL